MIAFGTFKKKAAFKLYARAKKLNFDLANEISAQIGNYDEAVKHADDDERDLLDIHDYVDEKYWNYLDQSSEYLGTIADKKKAPSAYLLYQGNIRREIGLIKCKSESTKKEYITCVIDGAIAENYKFLKNDILKVDVVLLIDKIFKRAGIEHFNVNKLIELVKNDEEVWRLYSEGYTIGLNQCEQDASRHKCMRYKPHNVSELSAFVAAIRPGFKSMYNRFEAREDFSWGIEALDKLIRTEELPQSYLFYQEQVMSVLNYAGFPMAQCYGIIKAIAKKHPEKVRPLKAQFIEGFKNKLMNDENTPEDIANKYASEVWEIVSDNCGYGFNCVSGSTKIIRGGSNNKFQPTVEEMYKIRHDKEYAKYTGHYDLHKKYNLFGYGFALSMCEDERLRPNRIVKIKPAGVRQTYEVMTKTGCHITCTDNHKFPTPTGKVELKDLKVGDVLYCKGEYKHKYFDTTLTDGNYEKNYPQKGQCGFQEIANGTSVVYDLQVDKHRVYRDGCEICGKEYSDDKRFELHHIDMNRHNNVESNLQWLCCSCHKKIHYKNGRNKRYDNGIETYLDEIVSIVPKCVEQVYDVEMDDPYHTFVSESGLVTSNSAHAFSMALDSLYNAWQKAHYPYEFYEVMLQTYSDKGNKDKVTKLKAEMKKAFGISEGGYKFGLDNRKFVADKEHNAINPALSSIKGLSTSLSETLYSLSDNKYNSFIDLLVGMSEYSINSKQLDTLIKIGYFSDFGSVNELLYQAKMFGNLYGKKTLSKDALSKYSIPEYIVTRQSKKITDKQFREFDSVELIKDICANAIVEETKTTDMLGYQLEFLGYISSTFPKLNDQYCYAVDVGGKYGNTITLYQLNNGDQKTYKCYKKTLALSPVSNGDVIKVVNITEKPKKCKDGDVWVDTDQMEEVLMKYIVCST